jgi:hypothetical protein
MSVLAWRQLQQMAVYISQHSGRGVDSVLILVNVNQYLLMICIDGNTDDELCNRWMQLSALCLSTGIIIRTVPFLKSLTAGQA